MNVLKNKSYRTYDYTSRYTVHPYYYNTVDKKYMYGITSQLSDETEYTLHNIKDVDTLDSLALYYYGRPDLYWIIADYNRIQDPFINLFEKYNYIYIPSLAGIRYKK